jgi:hypothetical protein
MHSIRMISPAFATTVILGSMFVSLAAYIWLSKREGTYLNVLTPDFIIYVPANFLFPLAYISLFGPQYSTYAFCYVYATLAVETVTFVYAYTRTGKRTFRLPYVSAHRNFTPLSVSCLALGILLYVPVLAQFREFLLDPRQIYMLTRTGFGIPFYISSILAYLAIIAILFTKRSWLVKASVIAAAAGLLLLHGSKGQVLTLVLILCLFHVYAGGNKVGVMQALVACFCIGMIVLSLFALTMSLGSATDEALETISQYVDSTRNAMLVIDSHFPVQYGRLTFETNTIARIPRAFMPGKPKNFGPYYLDEYFFPDWFDADTGSPDFGIGVQYADFGVLAIVYLTLFALFRGWLTRIFVNRLRITQHPADFYLLAFLAGISLLPVAAVWALPEAVLIALGVRYVSAIGVTEVFRERKAGVPVSSGILGPMGNV